jgi:hypothetical protein
MSEDDMSLEGSESLWTIPSKVRAPALLAEESALRNEL